MTKNSDPSGSVTASGHPAKCFVMQPFGKKQDPRSHKLVDNDKVYESIKAIERIRPTFPIHLFRANTEQYKGEDLHKHVLDSVNTSDFCVSDFTGQNVNVFYETGYARGTGKPIVVICQSRDDVPTDLKGLLTVPYRMDELHGLARDIDQHLNWVKVDVEGQRERTSASVKYFSTRGEADVGARIRAAKHRIDILQTNLATVQVSFLPDILAAR